MQMITVASRVTAVQNYRRQHGIRQAIRFYIKRVLDIPDYGEEIDTLFYFLNQCVDITQMPPAKELLEEVRKTKLPSCGYSIKYVGKMGSSTASHLALSLVPLGTEGSYLGMMILMCLCPGKTMSR